MKNTISHVKTVLGVAVSCSLLSAGALDAKPGKGKDKNQGGPPGHSEKGNGKDRQQQGGKGQEKADKDVGKHFDKKARKGAEKADRETVKWREKRFREDDRDSVIRYFSEFSDKKHGLPPGLAKNLRRGKPLPPGWRDKVGRGYVIENDYSEYFQPLSYELFPGLEVVPDTRLYRYGDRIVRVYEPRREVIDMFVVPTIRLD
jgi:hypothetical protein